MLSINLPALITPAAAEYNEASESCREIAYIRGILEDFYEVETLEPAPLYIDNDAACIAMSQMRSKCLNSRKIRSTSLSESFDIISRTAVTMVWLTPAKWIPQRGSGHWRKAMTVSHHTT